LAEQEKEKIAKTLIEFENSFIDFRLIKQIQTREQQNLEFEQGYSFDIILIYYSGEEEEFSYTTNELRNEKLEKLKAKLTKALVLIL